jgi:Mannosyl-glycoprotein endo-beta-N-acetylglucosaminidase
MRRWFSSGLAVFAGMVAIPAEFSTDQGPAVPVRDYRTDPRLESLRRFFEKAACPALAYSKAFLEAADRYALDWRLLPSISMVESTGGKAASHNNLFGWDSGRAQFSSPAAGIHAVGYRLAHSDLYRNKDTDEILATYNPNDGYDDKVKQVMRSIALSQ